MNRHTNIFAGGEPCSPPTGKQHRICRHISPTGEGRSRGASSAPALLLNRMASAVNRRFGHASNLPAGSGRIQHDSVRADRQGHFHSPHISPGCTRAIRGAAGLSVQPSRPRQGRKGLFGGRPSPRTRSRDRGEHRPIAGRAESPRCSPRSRQTTIALRVPCSTTPNVPRGIFPVAGG